MFPTVAESVIPQPTIAVTQDQRRHQPGSPTLFLARPCKSVVRVFSLLELSRTRRKWRRRHLPTNSDVNHPRIAPMFPKLQQPQSITTSESEFRQPEVWKRDTGKKCSSLRTSAVFPAVFVRISRRQQCQPDPHCLSKLKNRVSPDRSGAPLVV